MNKREKLTRILVGLCTTALVVIVGFAFVLQVIPTWGATAQEIERALPGDELVPDPVVQWTHGITINAPAHEVWGWVSQIGERRGGFYSYTFIENQMGNGNVYQNAARIVPEWQNPPPGTVMIQNAMEVKALEPGKWYLGASTNEMGWTWLWYLEPINENQTRLIVRSHIKPAGAMSNDIVGTVLNLGGFVMEQAMLQGIKMRAEGLVPPSYNELVETAVWLLALGMGLVAGLLFITLREWWLPGSAGVLAVLALIVFTFVQPPVGIRIFVDLTLFAMVGGAALILLGHSEESKPSANAGQGRLQPGTTR
jgi:hypothetical protein